MEPSGNTENTHMCCVWFALVHAHFLRCYSMCTRSPVQPGCSRHHQPSGPLSGPRRMRGTVMGTVHRVIYLKKTVCIPKKTIQYLHG